MANKVFKSSGNPGREAIMTKIDELTAAVAAYFAPFEKTTNGQQAMGETSLTFVEDCDKKADLFPEVLAGTFPKSEFKLKLGAVLDFFAFKQKIDDAVVEWDKAAKLCKADAMYYANKIYAAFQSQDDLKYQPTIEELRAFYKKTVSEKKAAEKAAQTAIPAATHA